MDKKVRNKRIRKVMLAAVALVLVAGVIFAAFGDTFKASAAISKSTGSIDAPITVNVPECIYLTPASSATTFSKYINNNNNGTVIAAPGSTGSIYFSCSGASNLKIKVSGVSAISIDGTARTNNTAFGVTLSSNAYSGTINSGSVPSLSAGSSTTIEWTFSYNYGSRSYETKAYTTIFAPNLVSAACEVARKRADFWVSKGDRAMANATVWLTGVHSISKNSNSARDADGAFNHNPIAENADVGTWTSGVSTSNVSTTSCTNDNEKPTNGNDLRYTAPGTGYTGYWTLQKDSGTSTIDGQYDGNITVDISRVTNLNQIPYLTAGVDIQEQWDAQQTRNGTVSLVAGSTSICSGTSSPNAKQNYQGYRFGSSINCSTSGSPSSVQLSATVTARVATANPRIKLNCTYVNKSNLRTAVQNAVKAGYCKSAYSDTTWNEYVTALTNASKALGQPDAPSSGFQGYIDDLNTAKTNLSRNNSFTAVVEYRYEDDNSLITSESCNYSYGDSVTANTTNDTVRRDAGAYANKGQAFYGSTQIGSDFTESSKTISNVTQGNLKFIFYFKTKPFNITLNDGFPSSPSTGNTPGGTNVEVCGSKPFPNVSVPSKVGFTFDGYWDVVDTGISSGQDGGTKYINSNGSSAKNWDKGRDAILYGHWTANNYTITYNTNKPGSASATPTQGTASATVTFDQRPSSISKPTLTGWTFGGYYTDSACSGTQVIKADGSANTIWSWGENKTLYAKWTPNAYDISFAGNGSTSGTTSRITGVKYDEVKQLTANGFSKAYTVTYDANSGICSTSSDTATYTFNGWKVTAGLDTSTAKYGSTSSPSTAIGTDTIVPNNSYVKNINPSSTAVTMTAQWISDSVTLPTPTRTGYTFAGWYDGSTKAGNAGVSYTPNATKTLTAHWTANTYTVNYNGNGSTSGSTADSSHTYDTAKNLTANGFTRAYTVTYNKNDSTAFPATISDNSATATYVFGGWNTASDGSGTSSYANSASVINLTSTANGSVTLYAQWTSTAVTLPTPARTGWTFDGWYDAASGGNSVGAGGATYTPNSDKTIYAHWTAKKYDIVVNGNGGKLNGNDTWSVLKTSSTCITTGASSYCTLGDWLTKTRTGYTFSGFYDAQSGGEKVYNADGTCVKGGTYWNSSGEYCGAKDMNLYAHWTANTYTVTYNGNDSTSGSMSPSTHTYDTAKNLTANAFTRAYTVTFNSNGSSASPASVSPASATAAYTFNGWNTASNGSGTAYTNSQSVKNLKSTQGDNLDIYAQWTSTTVTLPLPTRTGYTFAGWWDAASGGNSIGSNGAAITPTANTTIYAHWTAKTFTVTFDKNGGDTCSPATKTVTYDAAYGTLATTTRTGYTFAGWFTAASGGTQITNTSTVRITAAQTLYAHWTANTYTVTFDKNGGDTCSTGSKTVTYDSTYGDLPVPVKDGHDFVGWFTSASGGTQVKSDTTVKITAAQTLYAHWSIKKYYLDVNWDYYDGTTSNVSNASDAGYAKADVTAEVSRTGIGDYYSQNTYGTSWTIKAYVTDANKYILRKSNGTYVSEETRTGTMGSSNHGETFHIRPVIKVVYNGNGTTTSPASCSIAAREKLPYGESMTVSSTVPTRTGYTFTGWNTQANGSGTSYGSGATLTNYNTTAGATVTLYAQWSAISNYTISFDENDGRENSYNLFNVSKKSGSRTYAGHTLTASIEYGNFLTHCTGGSIDKYDTYAWRYDISEFDGANSSGLKNAGDYIYEISDPTGNRDHSDSRAVIEFFTDGSCSNKANIWIDIKDDPISLTTLNLPDNVSGMAIFFKTEGTYVGSSNHPENYTFNVNFRHGYVNQAYDAPMKTVKVPTRTGYDFDGYWSKNGTSTGDWGTQYYNADGTSHTVWHENGSKTLYAKWKKFSYKVSYAGNYSTGGSMSTQTFYFDEAAKVTANAFSRAYTVTCNYNDASLKKTDGTNYSTANHTQSVSYNFAGWKATSGLASGAVYGLSSSPSTAVSSDTVIPNEYYVKNLSTTKNATVTLTAQWNNVGFTLPTPANHPGYTFDGWYTASSGGTRVGGAGDSYNPVLTSNPTYYAHWTAKTYEITFEEQNEVPYNLFDATSFTSQKNFNATYSYTQGGTFREYGDIKSGIDANDNDVDRNVMETRIWNANDYIFKASNKSGGSGGTGLWLKMNKNANGDNNNKDVSSDVYTNRFVSENILKNTYVVRRLSDAAASAEGQSFQTYSSSEPYIYYRLFANNDAGDDIDYTVHIELYHGIQCNYNALPKTVKPPVWDGHEFLGYYTESGGGTKVFNADGTPAITNFRFTSDTKLYGHWKTFSYVVRFAGGGATSGSMADVSYDFGEVKNLPANAFFRSYTLICDYNGKDTNGNDVINGSGVAYTTASTTLTSNYSFSSWSANGIYSGGTQPPYSNQQSVKNLSSTRDAVVVLTATWNSQALTLPTPAARPGYTFVGWYDAVSGGNKIADAGASYTPSSNKTIYGRWQPKNVEIFFDEQVSGMLSTNMFRFSSAYRLRPEYCTVYLDNGRLTIGSSATGDEYKSHQHDRSDYLLYDLTGNTRGAGAEIQNKVVKTVIKYVDSNGNAVNNAGDYIFKTWNNSGSNDGSFIVVEFYKNGAYKDNSNKLSPEKFYELRNASYDDYWVADSNCTTFAVWLKGQNKPKDYGWDVSLNHAIRLPFNSTPKTVKVPTWDNTTFMGYYTQPNGQGTKVYNEKGQYVMNGGWYLGDSVTLYAYWEARLDLNGTIADTIGYDLGNAGTCDILIKKPWESSYTKVADNVKDWCQNVPVGTQWKVEDVTSKVGFSYEGWIEKTGDNTGTLHSGSTDAHGTVYGNSTYYGNYGNEIRLKYDAGKYTVTFDEQGGKYGDMFQPVTGRTKNGLTYTYDPDSGYITFNGTISEDINRGDPIVEFDFNPTWGKDYVLSISDFSGSLQNIQTVAGVAPPNGCIVCEFCHDLGGYSDRSSDPSNPHFNFRDIRGGSDAGEFTFNFTQGQFSGGDVNKFCMWVWTNCGEGGKVTFRDYRFKVTIYPKEGHTRRVTYGTSNTNSGVPTMTGYEFKGYYTQPNGQGTCYFGPTGNAVKSWDIPNDTKLYAYWKVRSYKLDMNGFVSGAIQGNIDGFGTFDISVDGVSKGTGINDFYQDVPYGAQVKITNIQQTEGNTYCGWKIQSSDYSNPVGDRTVTFTMPAVAEYKICLIYKVSAYRIAFDENIGNGSNDITVAPLFTPGGTVSNYGFTVENKVISGNNSLTAVLTSEDRSYARISGDEIIIDSKDGADNPAQIKIKTELTEYSYIDELGVQTIVVKVPGVDQYRDEEGNVIEDSRISSNGVFGNLVYTSKRYVTTVFDESYVPTFIYSDGQYNITTNEGKIYRLSRVSKYLSDTNNSSNTILTGDYNRVITDDQGKVSIITRGVVDDKYPVKYHDTVTIPENTYNKYYTITLDYGELIDGDGHSDVNRRGGYSSFRVYSEFDKWKTNDVGGPAGMLKNPGETVKELTGETFDAEAEPITGLITFNAQWKDKKFDDGVLYTYDENGNTVIGEKIGSLPVPTKLGYTFVGWYDEDGHEVNMNYRPTKHTTIHAEWTTFAVGEVVKAYDFTTGVTLDLTETFMGFPNGGKLRIGKALKEGKVVGMFTTSSALETETTYLANDGYVAELKPKTGGGECSKNSKLIFTAGNNSTIKQFYYEYSYTDNGLTQYVTGIFTMVPANNLYHEESEFETNINFSNDYTDAVQWYTEYSKVHSEKIEGDEYPVYGYNINAKANINTGYSNGKALKAPVQKGNTMSKTSRYTFTGKGFDLYSACGVDTSALVINVFADGDSSAEGSVPISTAVVDTYMSDDTLISTCENNPNIKLLRQVPVYHFMANEPGTYCVEVNAMWINAEPVLGLGSETEVEEEIINQVLGSGIPVNEETMDIQFVDDNSILNGGSGADIEAVTATATDAGDELYPLLGARANTLSGYIDGIRVYETTELNDGEYVDYNKYYIDTEKYSAFYNIKQITRSASTENPLNEYTGYSTTGYGTDPINEIYLAKYVSNKNYGATGFKIDNFEDVNRVMVSIRVITGNPTVYVWGKNVTSGVNILPTSGTEMFFDLTNYIGDTGIIYMKSVNYSGRAGGYAAIGTVKICYKNGEAELMSAGLLGLNAQELAEANEEIMSVDLSNAQTYLSEGVSDVVVIPITTSFEKIELPEKEEPQNVPSSEDNGEKAEGNNGSSDVTPGGNTDVNTDVTPGGSSDVTPGGNTDVNPGGDVVTPGGSEVVTPGGTTITPVTEPTDNNGKNDAGIIIRGYNANAEINPDYRSTVNFYSAVSGNTTGLRIQWYVNEEAVKGENKATFSLKEVKSLSKVQVRLLDASGNTVSSSETVTVTPKAGFIQKIIAFLRSLFNRLPVIDTGKPNA